MAECHPVGFQWVMEARQRGTKVFHIDPRFSRTSASVDRYLPIRAGSDIALLGALINHVLSNGLDFREYVLAYTNAATLVNREFRDTEDLDGLFSGYDEETGRYDPSTWAYEGDRPEEEELTEGGRHHAEAAGSDSYGARGAGASASPPSDPTLTDPRCVYQILKRHYSRYTPEMVEELCGIPPERFRELAEAVTANSGRERTTAWVYSVGWTQHSVGVQYIRAASILQLLLGNMGRPGGGIMALRGHASIQGSTDIPTLFNLLPGYIAMPHAHRHDGLDDYLEREGSDTGWWGNRRAYVVSLLKAWWGDAATEDNDYHFDYLPRLTGDHGHYSTVMGQIDGKVKGYFVVGENPAVGSANGKAQRLGLANLDWLVVRDLVMVETATFWKDAPEIETGELRTEEIGTEVFFMPAATHVEKEGTFTNTQRLLQWREKALDPPGDCRSDLWFYHHLGKRIRRRLGDDEIDRPVMELTWDYPEIGERRDPSAEAVLREIGGVDADGRPLASLRELKPDGSTSCGCWIYCGVYADGVNQAARRKPHTEQGPAALEWGWAWPANRRILYNRASADPEGRPWSERKKYVYWDAEQGRWAGPDVPDFEEDKAPGYVPPEGAKAQHALAGTDPFIMQSDGKGWLYVPSGLSDGPLPTHYEPHESAVRNTLYGQQANPARRTIDRPENPYNPALSPRFPYVYTTSRLTEHHTTGAMSRPLPYLAELQPEAFCEVSREMAEEIGLENGGWATIVTARTAIELRVLVTGRVRPLRVNRRTVHQVIMPYHWGYGGGGVVTGDVVNDLVSVVLDPNVYIQESKAGTCDVLPGRRPRGQALLDLIERYRDG